MYGRTCGRCGGLMGIVDYVHEPDYQPNTRRTRYGDRATWRCDQCQLTLRDATGDYRRSSLIAIGIVFGAALVGQGIGLLPIGARTSSSLFELICRVTVGVGVLAIAAYNLPSVVTNWWWLRRSPLRRDADASDSGAPPPTPRTSS